MSNFNVTVTSPPNYTVGVTTTPPKTITIQTSGLQGIAGPGVPPGGTPGQVLTKTDGTDYNTEWSDPTGGGGGGGVTDHGALTGLSDDDHPQYHTDARGDARYFTQSQVTTALAGKVNTDGAKQLSTEDYSTAEKSKLAGIASGATQNSADAALLSRSNHTGTQAASTIIEDSTHRFATDAEKTTWNAKEGPVTAGTTGQYYRGDKTFQTLDKTAVGLGSVDNVADSAKPVSTAQATAIALKENAANKDNGTLSSSTTTFPTSGAVKSYVDTADALDVKLANNLSDLPSKSAARTNLNIDAITRVSNANYTILVADKHIFQVGTMSAVRTWTLPLLSSYTGDGKEIIIGDASGTVNETNYINIVTSGSDVFSDGTTSLTIKTAGGLRSLVQDKTSGRWSYDRGQLRAMRPANSFPANNTAAEASVTNEYYKAANDQTYSGTITQTGTTAASGTATHRYSWARIGPMVHYYLTIHFATHGTAITAVVADFPTDMPAPLNQGSIAAASEILYMSNTWMLTNRTGVPTAVGRGAIWRNAAGTGYEFRGSYASAQNRTFQFWGCYPAA